MWFLIPEEEQLHALSFFARKEVRSDCCFYNLVSLSTMASLTMTIILLNEARIYGTYKFQSRVVNARTSGFYGQVFNMALRFAATCAPRSRAVHCGRKTSRSKLAPFRSKLESRNYLIHCCKFFYKKELLINYRSQVFSFLSLTFQANANYFRQFIRLRN